MVVCLCVLVCAVLPDNHPKRAPPPSTTLFHTLEESWEYKLGPTLEESWEYKLGPSRGNREDKLGPLSRKAGSINLGPNWLKRSWIE